MGGLSPKDGCRVRSKDLVRQRDATRSYPQRTSRFHPSVSRFRMLPISSRTKRAELCSGSDRLTGSRRQMTSNDHQQSSQHVIDKFGEHQLSTICESPEPQQSKHEVLSHKLVRPTQRVVRFSICGRGSYFLVSGGGLLPALFQLHGPRICWTAFKRHQGLLGLNLLL